MGVTVRGMEFAMASGIIAADTIAAAKEANDFTAKALSDYERRLQETFVLKDLAACREMPEFLDNESFFSYYPDNFPGFLEKIMWFGDGPKEKIGATLWKEMKGSGMLSLKIQDCTISGRS